MNILRDFSKLLFLCVLVASLSVSAAAEHFSIKTAKGYLHIYNGEELSFTAEINGREVKPLQVAGNPAFNVDGTLVQLLFVSRPDFDPEAKFTDKNVLIGHRDWELDYLKEIFDSRPSAESETLHISGREHLYWGFTRPKHMVEFDRDYFITTALGKDVIGLSSPIKKGDALDSYKDRFRRIMQSVKISKTRFNVKELADEIRKAAGR